MGSLGRGGLETSSRDQSDQQERSDVVEAVRHNNLNKAIAVPTWNDPPFWLNIAESGPGVMHGVFCWRNTDALIPDLQWVADTQGPFRRMGSKNHSDGGVTRQADSPFTQAAMRLRWAPLTLPPLV